MHPILSIVGRANSGKTTVLKDLIAELKRRGFSVAVIKHAGEDFDIDTEGKDTWHFRQAGSDMVAISSTHQLAVMQKITHDLSPQEILRAINGNYDILLTEGFKKANTYQIEVHRKGQDKELVGNPRQLLAVITDEPLEVAVPQFSREAIGKVADLIEEKVFQKGQKEEIELYVNDSFVTLNPFVQKFLVNILTGFVTSLKGIHKVKDIRISLRRNE